MYSVCVQSEAVVLTSLPSPPSGNEVPLYTWFSPARQDYALTNSSTTPPDAQGGCVCCVLLSLR